MDYLIQAFFGGGVFCLVGAFLVLIVVLVIFSYLRAKKRREALHKWAKSHGWRFSADYEYDLDNRFPDFSCLRQGSGRYAYNTVVGSDAGRPFRSFDYHYETHSTDSKGRRQTHHHYFSAIIVQTDLPLKPLFLRAEGFFDRVGEFFGFDDIDFESAEFSRTFCVKAPDRRWAFDVLHQETMEFLLESPHFTLDFQGRHVIAYRNGTFSVEEFEDALAVVAGVLDRLPEYLLRELKGKG